MVDSGIKHELCRLIAVVDVATDELSMVVANSFATGRIPDGGRDVLYGSEDDQVGLRLTYARSGRLIGATAGPALTDEVARSLIDQIHALAAGGEPTLWRWTEFSSVPLQGYWRYRDQWQIR